MARPLVAGVGDPCLDVVGILPPGAEPSGSHELAEVTLQGGGRIPLALSAATALGCRARLAARLGDDDFGRFIRAGLEEDGLELEHVMRVPGRLSPFRFVAVSGTRRRAAYRTAGDLDLTTASTLDVDAFIDGAAVVVLDGQAEGMPLTEIAERARAAGAHVIVCVSELAQGVGDLLTLATTLIVTEGFAAEVAPRGELEDSLVELQRMGPARVVVTRGLAGALGLDGDLLVMQPAFELPIVDPTGSTSVFAGAYAAAVAHDQSFERALELASAAACVAAGTLGGRAGIPGHDELTPLLGWRLGEAPSPAL